MLNWIKKYYLVLTIIGFVITFLVGALVGTEGLLWKTQENERATIQLELNKYNTAKDLYILLEITNNNILDLNEEFIKTIKTKSLSSQDSSTFYSKLKFFINNYYSIEKKLAWIEGRKENTAFIPEPILTFARPPKPEFGTITMSYKGEPSFIIRNYIVKGWVIVLSITTYVLLAIFIFLYFYNIKKMRHLNNKKLFK